MATSIATLGLRPGWPALEMAGAREGGRTLRKSGEKKTDNGKSHEGIWRSDAPEASQGQTRDVPGTPGTFGPDLCVNQY